jgi:hypothetical protein
MKTDEVSGTDRYKNGEGSGKHEQNVVRKTWKEEAAWQK